MAKENSTIENNVNQINAGTQINGDINLENDIRFDGTLTGNLHTKGKLVLGPSGKIIGTVLCKNAAIEGKIDGKITVSELLNLKNTSFIQGDIITNKLSIEPGAKFTGNCDMTGTDKAKMDVGSAKEEKSKGAA